MEKRKLLLIVISVGVFLVIVVGATMLVFAPKSSAIDAGSSTVAEATVPDAGPASVDASEWLRNPSAVPGLVEPASPGPAGQGTSGRGDVIIIYGDRPNQGTAPETGATTTATGEGGLVIEVPGPSPVVVPEPSAGTAKPEPAPKQNVTAPKKEQPKSAPPKPASVPKKPVKIVDDFWVQTGSFSAKTRADAAKETLAAKGIASLVETKDVDGKTFYRVRVGPYASKSEAEYWLSLVKNIEGFGESYVSLAKAKR